MRLLIFDLIAEQKIAEAISRGELANLPGEGKPLDLDDDRLVPEDLRMAYRILRNAGFVPPEVEAVREIGELIRFIDTLSEDDGDARNKALKRLQVLRLRLEAHAPGHFGIRADEIYYQRVLDRFR